MDGAQIVKKLLPLIILFSGVAQAQIDDITITGMAEPLPNSTIPYVGHPLPFSLTFTVDTNSGTQYYQFYETPREGLGTFSVQNLTVTNAAAQIGGVSVPMGSTGSGFGSGDPGVVFSEFVIGSSINNFNWEVDIPTTKAACGPVSTCINVTYLDSLFQQINAEYLDESPATRGLVHCCDNGSSSLDGYEVDMRTISVVSVPEPGTLSLLTMAFVGLFASRVRRSPHRPLRSNSSRASSPPRRTARA